MYDFWVSVSREIFPGALSALIIQHEVYSKSRGLTKFFAAHFVRKNPKGCKFYARVCQFIDKLRPFDYNKDICFGRFPSERKGIKACLMLR